MTYTHFTFTQFIVYNNSDVDCIFITIHKTHNRMHIMRKKIFIVMAYAAFWFIYMLAEHLRLTSFVKNKFCGLFNVFPFSYIFRCNFLLIIYDFIIFVYHID